MSPNYDIESNISVVKYRCVTSLRVNEKIQFAVKRRDAVKLYDLGTRKANESNKTRILVKFAILLGLITFEIKMTDAYWDQNRL